MALRYALLGLLAERPSSGYELAKVFRKTLDHVWHAQACQLYPELNRLAGEGLTTVVEEGARGRRTYAITSEGRAALRRWLITPDTEPPARDPAALRAFLVTLLPPEEGIDLVRRHGQHARAYADYLTQWANEAKAVGTGPDGVPPADADVFGVLAAELGIRLNAAVVEWAAWAERALAEGSHERAVLDES
ncbi:MAG: PadR family transcriptional regulator [Actinomycetales bacterium]|nr:PadR family transcriptional regulator [Actinomycetales bacterium]